MLARVFVLAAVTLSCLQPTVAADQESVTPDQVIDGYLHAIGAEKFPSITTFIERGEVQNTITNPNAANLGRLALPPALRQRERYENYFKTPNLRFTSTISENNQIIGIHGCDGKVTWYIDAELKRQEFTPKPDQEYDCAKGFRILTFPRRDEHTKVRLAGKKKMAGRIAWEIKIANAKSQGPDTYYFDTETYLLLRYERRGYSMIFSDYREVSGIKVPFNIIREDGYIRATITVREVQVNVPIDDARFVEPHPTNGSISLNPILPAPTVETRAAVPAAPQAPAPAVAPPQPAVTPPSTQLNYPNFITCTLAELESWVPDLRRMKPAPDQSDLQSLLEKIGVKLRDTAHNTPNLISREVVTGTAQGSAGSHREYDYLIVPHVEGTEISLNEFRADLKTGEKFQVDNVKPASQQAGQAAPVEMTRAREQQPPASDAGRQPLSQGFASSWVYFFPHNQMQSAFRYLGEQKLDGRRSVVLAFAQKPETVTSPGLFRYQGRSVPMYFQGVAWFDPSDFRILRIRTELLFPLPDVALQQLSADIQFAATRISSVSTILDLPKDVNVTSVVGGATVREHHTYADYRIFRTQSRILEP